MNILNPNKKILIVSHDAGGAEIISAYIKKFNLKCDYFLKGPAVKIFKMKIPKIKILKNINKIFNKYNLIICGSSLNNNFEFNIIKKSKLKKIHVICFIDHWVNYIDRFRRNFKIILPDEIIVGDIDAIKIARKVFKNIKISYCKNFYFESFKKKNKKIRKNLNILYVSSNMNSFKNKEISDKKILENVIYKITKNSKFKKIKKLIIRKHPSESFSKFNFIKNVKLKFKIEIDDNFLLKDTLNKTDVIIGYDSMALVVGKLYGLKTINLYTSRKTQKIPFKYIDQNIKVF